MFTKSVVPCFAVAAVFVSFCVAPASAQTSMGRISGTVADASGAAVPDAKITVVNVDTQGTRTTSTDNNGLYTVTNLPIGNYTVEAAKEGFKVQATKGLNLVADGR